MATKIAELEQQIVEKDLELQRVKDGATPKVVIPKPPPMPKGPPVAPRGRGPVSAPKPPVVQNYRSSTMPENKPVVNEKIVSFDEALQAKLKNLKAVDQTAVKRISIDKKVNMNCVLNIANQIRAQLLKSQKGKPAMKSFN